MRCRSLKTNAMPARWWHCLWCAECRRARAIDMDIAFEVRKMRWDLPPIDGVSRTLAALDVVQLGRARRRIAWRTGRRLLCRIALVFGSVTGLTGTWLYVANRDPNIPVPTSAMPSPNGFDYFRRASSAFKDEKKLNDVEVALSVNRKSGSHIYPQVPGPLGAPVARKGNRQSKIDSHVYSQAELESLVKENAGVVTLLHQGFQYPYRNPPVRSFSATFSYLNDFRATARFLSLKGQTEAHRGDWNAAMDSWLDAVEMGERIPRGGVLIVDMVGLTCQAIGRKPVWSTYEHLNAAQSRTAARRLEGIMAQHVPYADALQEEGWSQQAGLQEAFRKANWLRELTAMGPSHGLNLNTAVYALRIAFYGKRRLLEINKRYMDQIVANARQPYAMKIPDPLVPDDPISAYLMPIFSQAYFKDVTSEAENGLLLTTLALHAYRLEHGDYPKTLDALVPTYLEQIPTDPFALQGPLRYKRTNTRYVLYSVGPDGKDDGGRRIDNLQQATQAQKATFPRPLPKNDVKRFMVNMDGVGDVVAGVNIN